MTETNNKNYFYFWTAVIVNIVFYLVLIVRHPYFLTDDFLNFGIITTNFSNFISFKSANVSGYEKFYFYTRPLTYLISLIDLKIFSANSFLMKIFSLCLHIILLFSFYSLLKQILLFFKLEVNNIAILLTVIFFGLHPNNMWWIYWISNQNEMLMIFFFVLSLYSVFAYLNYSEKRYLYYYLLFYILSIVTKQQGVNLPILILIFIYFYKSTIIKDKFLQLRNYSLGGIALMILYSAFTFMFSINDFKLEYLFKKPFSLVGNLLYVIFPLNSLSNYEYFVQHKLVACIAGLSISLCIILLIVYKKLKFRSLLFAMLLIVASFYPRIIDGANNRINSIQVLLFSIAILLLLSYSNQFKKYFIAGAAFLIVFNCIEANSLLTYYSSLKDIQLTQASEFLKDKNENKTVAISFWSHLLPYQTYFLKNNSFGKDEYKMLPLSYNSLNSGKSFVSNNKIECLKREDAIDFRTVQDPEVRIDIDNFNKDSGVYKYLQSDINYDKGFKVLTFPLSDKYKNDKFIYFNGLKWIGIN